MERRDKFVDNPTSFAYATYNMIDEYGIDMPVSGNLFIQEGEIAYKVYTFLGSYTEFIPLIQPNMLNCKYYYETKSWYNIDKTCSIFNGKSEKEFIKCFENLTKRFDKHMFVLANILVPMQMKSLQEFYKLNGNLPYDNLYMLYYKDTAMNKFIPIYISIDKRLAYDVNSYIIKNAPSSIYINSYMVKKEAYGKLLEKTSVNHLVNKIFPLLDDHMYASTIY